MSGTVHHIYMCGHSTVESLCCMGQQDVAVFVESGCPEYVECAMTDPAWFAQQGQAATPQDYAALEKLEDELNDIYDAFDWEFAVFDSLGPISPCQVKAESSSSDIAQLLTMPRRSATLDKLLGTALTFELLEYAKGFVDYPRHRAFFDHCMQSVDARIQEAQVLRQALREAMEQRQRGSNGQPLLTLAQRSSPRVRADMVETQFETLTFSPINL